MGNCFKTCLPQSDAARTLRNLNILNNQNTGLDFTYLVEDNTSTCEANKRSCKTCDIQLQCLDAGALLQRTATSTPASSLDLEWEHETLPTSINNDPSGSSWQPYTNSHKYWKNWRREEYHRNSIFQIDTTQRHDEQPRLRTAFPEDLSQCPSNSSPQNTAPAHNSDSDWSRVSSANSLEWDNVQNSIHVSSLVSEVDTDTQFLLQEIERLTNKTLQETGQDLYS